MAATNISVVREFGEFSECAMLSPSLNTLNSLTFLYSIDWRPTKKNLQLLATPFVFFTTFAQALVLGWLRASTEIKWESGANPEQFPLL